MQPSYAIKRIPYSNQETFSVSKLKSYSLCSKYYEYQYVLGLREYSFSYSTLLGSICHNSLELMNLENKDLLECLDLVFIDTLISSGVIEDSINQDIIEHLKEYNKHIQTLYTRASKDYNEKDAIRKKDGGIAKNPTFTTDWKNEVKKLNLDELKENINSYFQKYSQTNFEFEISELYAESFRWLSIYKKPEEEQEVLFVEFGLSHLDKETQEILNPCYITDNEKYLLRAYIDKIGIYSYEDETGIGIIDYKSSASEMDLLHVSNNEQLYIYAYAYEKLTGKEVKFIGIENIKYQNLNLVKVDKKRMKDIVENFFFRVKMIEERMFYKEHSPDSKYSKCLDNYGKICPYLNYCYPETQQELNKNMSIEEMLKSL